MRVDNDQILADDPSLEPLLRIARRNGYVTFDDLTDQLPIARMSALEIAQAVARLERAGILIEVDPDPLLEPADARTEFDGPVGSELDELKHPVIGSRAAPAPRQAPENNPAARGAPRRASVAERPAAFRLLVVALFSLSLALGAALFAV